MRISEAAAGASPCCALARERERSGTRGSKTAMPIGCIDWVNGSTTSALTGAAWDCGSDEPLGSKSSRCNSCDCDCISAEVGLIKRHKDAAMMRKSKTLENMNKSPETESVFARLNYEPYRRQRVVGNLI